MSDYDYEKILMDYYNGVGKTIFLNSKGRLLFKMKSAYGTTWDETKAEKAFLKLKKKIEEGQI
jgi:hypothetical protein